MPTLVLQGVDAGIPPTRLSLRRLYSITGVTRSSVGTPIGSCAVHLYRTSTDVKVDRRTSNVAGAYTCTCYDQDRYYVVGHTTFSADDITRTADSVAFTADMAEIEGVTVNTLQGT